MGTPSVILSLPLLQVGPNNSSNGPRCSEEGQEVGRQHQRPSCPRHQVGQVHPRLQVDPQGHALGQVQARPDSGNAPPLRRSELEYYAMLSHTPVHLYQGSNVALGTAAGRLFRVGVLSIEDAGDSDLLSISSQSTTGRESLEGGR